MYEVTRYMSRDGQEFKTARDCIEHEASLNGLFNVCPKCKGKGHVLGDPITKMVYDEALTGYSGSMTPMYSSQVTGYKQIDCDVCHGHGYTKNEVKEITKQVVVGYA